nr:tetratricopeptide repeat protein [Streptomonospora nanhaiensis]
MGRLEQAEETARRALAAAPDDPEALYGLSRVLAARGDVRAAVETAERLVAVLPGESTSHYWYALLFAETGAAVEALPHAREAVRLAPGAALEAAALAYTAARVVGCENEARAAAARAVRLEPADPTIHSLVRDVYAALGDWEDARRAAQAVVAAEPADPVSRLCLGEALPHLGRHAEADDALTSALAQRPAPERIAGTLATLLKAGLPDLLVPHAAGTDDRLVLWQLRVAKALRERARRPEEARPLLRALFADNPDHPAVRTQSACLAHEDDRDSRTAWELVAPLIERDHDSPVTHALAVRALTGLGRLDEAVALARAARGRWPHGGPVLRVPGGALPRPAPRPRGGAGGDRGGPGRRTAPSGPAPPARPCAAQRRRGGGAGDPARRRGGRPGLL